MMRWNLSKAGDGYNLSRGTKLDLENAPMNQVIDWLYTYADMYDLIRHNEKWQAVYMFLVENDMRDPMDLVYEDEEEEERNEKKYRAPRSSSKSSASRSPSSSKSTSSSRKKKT